MESRWTTGDADYNDQSEPTHASSIWRRVVSAFHVARHKLYSYGMDRVLQLKSGPRLKSRTEAIRQLWAKHNEVVYKNRKDA